MMIIDTHCHLDDNRYNDDLDDVINRARKDGIGGFLIPGADINDIEKIHNIVSAYDDVYYAVGVHPYDKDGYDEDILLKYASSPKCVAVGECGLDYFRLPKDENEKNEEKRLQKQVFLAQLELAIKLQKPVILHIRDANEDCFEILKEYAPRLKQGAVMHCYNASPLLLELIKYGDFYFGIGGVLTFSNAKKLIEILPQIPKDRLLIETDSPYLTPTPYRGERNEPVYTRYVAKKMAEILNLSEAEICETTTLNANRLFKCFAS